MSEPRILRGFFLLCAAVFLLHFGMTVLHNIPEKYLSPRMESYSHLWCYPTFHQGWALFAPEPQAKHKRMELRYETSEGWTDWHRAESICVEEHQKYRVTHYSKLCHVTQNTVYHLWMDVDLFNAQEKPAKEYYSKSMGYGIAMEYAKNYAFHFLDDPVIESVEIRLILEDPFEEEEPEVLYFPVKDLSDES